MRINLRVLAVTAAISVLAPRPSLSQLPSCITLVGTKNGIPDPSGAFDVHVGGPYTTVRIVFTNCSDMMLSSTQPNPTADVCSDLTVSHDVVGGVAHFAPILGSAANRFSHPASGFGCAEVRGDPGDVLIGTMSVSAYDQNGTNGVEPGDFLLSQSDGLQFPGPPRSDFTCNQIVNASDLTLLCLKQRSDESHETPARCDGAATTSPVHAASGGGINLAWDDCGSDGSPFRTSTCLANTGSNVLVASLVAPTDVFNQITGIEAELDVIAAPGQALPSWWRFDTGGCRGGSAWSLQTVPSTTNCLPVIDNGGGNCQSFATYPAPDIGTEHISVSLDVAQAEPLVPGTEYALFGLAISNTKTTGTGACPGCDQPVQIVLRSVRLLQRPVGQPADLPTIVVTTPAASTVVTWQGSGRIAGDVFHDRNRDEVREVGGPGNEELLQGWTIQLKSPSLPTRTAVTDVNGHYVFDGVAPGTYDLSEVPQFPWVATLPATGQYASLAVANGSNLQKNFGNWQRPATRACFEMPYGALMSVWYPFDEPPGSGISHETVGGLNGSWVAPTVVEAGKVGRALQFTSAASFVQAGSGAANNFGAGKSFSMECWVLLNNPGATGHRTIVNKSSPSGKGYEWFIESGMLGLKLNDGTSASFIAQSSDLTVPGWHHVAAAVTRDVGPGSVRLFVNGASQPLQPSPPTVPLGDLSTTAFFRIGQQLNGTSDSFNGTIDELSLYKTALTDAQIMSIKNADAAGRCKLSSSIIPEVNGSTGYCVAPKVKILRITNRSGIATNFRWTAAAFADNLNPHSCPILCPQVLPAAAGHEFNLQPGPQPMALPFSIAGATCSTQDGIYFYSGTAVTDDNVNDYSRCAAKLDYTRALCPGCGPSGPGMPTLLRSMRMLDAEDDTSVVQIPLGAQAPLGFDIANLSASDVDMAYGFSSFLTDSEPATFISLNGLPPGDATPAATITIPAYNQVHLSVNAEFTEFAPAVLPNVILSIDPGMTGTMLEYASRAIEVTDPTLVGVEDGVGSIGDAPGLALRPNPFGSEVEIEFSARAGGRAEVSVFDVNGRRVHRSEMAFAVGGIHHQVWNGRDGEGRIVREGLYFVRVTLGDRVFTGRVIRLGR